ncbi:MAG: hypothetical protein ACK50A_17695 [Sphingobacteriaceae bacterium]
MELIGKKDGASFIFYKDGVAIYKAQLMSAFWGQRISIFDLTSSAEVVSITKKLRLIFNGSTLINFLERANNDNLEIQFHFSHTFEFKYKNSIYKFINHKGNVSSIFENNFQIGMYQKKHIVFFDSNGLTIKINSNADILLILSVLCVTDLEFMSEESAISIDTGQTFPSKLEYNNRWKPT